MTVFMTKWWIAMWDWIDSRYIVRRALLAATFFLASDSYVWAKHFADTTDKTGAEVGLIVAAVTGPVSLLLGQIAKLYNDGKGT